MTELSQSRRGVGIVRKIIPLVCAMAFFMSFDGVYGYVKQADPYVKVLLGAGAFFFVWLLILWDDLLQARPGRPAGETGDGGADSGKRIEALLGAFAAGTLAEPFAVLVASHRQMKTCDQLPAALADILRPRHTISVLSEMEALMPLALRAYVARHLGAPRWRTILPGIKQCRIPGDARAEASFLRCRPGSAIPAHTHAGLEAVLVLQGAFSDAHGHYVRGDMAVADPTIDHRPVADPAEECIIFIVQEAEVKLTGPIGRIIQRVVGG
jgi:putative transcriptional regulator